METIDVEANGQKFRCLQEGEGERGALLLHGFPDDAGSMTGLMEKLAEAGYRCWAPWLRGYGPSGQPAAGDYRLETIAGDVVALAEKLSPKPVLLIGHDWGAAIAYVAATRSPERFERIVTLAVPPLATFSRALRRHPAQMRRSWYMLFFQLRGLSEWGVRRNNFAFIDRLWRDWSPGWDYDARRMEEVKTTLSAPGSLKAALSYYRQNLFPRGGRPLPVPVTGLVLAGRNDGCIGVEIYDGIERDFSAPVRFEIIENAGHFAHLEQPQAVWDTIRSFLPAVTT